MIQEGILYRTGGGRHDWIPSNGSEPIQDITNHSNAPINQELRAVIERGILVDWERIGLMADEYVTRKHVALMYLFKPGSVITEDHHRKIQRHAKEVERWQRVRARGLWDVRWEGFCVYDGGSWLLPSWRGGKDIHIEQVQQQCEHRNIQFNPTYWHGYGGSLDGPAGLSYVGTRFYTRTAITSRGSKTIDHEQGHAFGQGHSDGYGDPKCAQAHASPYGWNICKLLAYDLITDDHQKTVQGSGYGFLAPIECWPQDVYDGECQALMTQGVEPRPGGQIGTLIVSNKKGQNQNYQGAYDGPGVVQIHEFDPAHRWTSTESHRRLASLLPGNIATIDGVTFTYEAIQEGTAKIKITRPESDLPTEPEWPRARVLGGDQIGLEQNALWHDPRYDKQGIELYVLENPKDNQPPVNGYWFTQTVQGPRDRTASDRGSNGQAWYYLEGQWDGPNVKCQIYKVIGPNEGDIRHCGHGVLRLISGNRLEWKYYCEDYGRDHMILEVLGKRFDHPRNGLWSTGDREGFTYGVYRTKKPDGTYGPEQHLQFYYAHNGTEPYWYMISNDQVTQPKARYFAYTDQNEFPEMGDIGRSEFDGETFTLPDKELTATHVF